MVSGHRPAVAAGELSLAAVLRAALKAGRPSLPAHH